MSVQSLDDLNSKFALPGLVRYERGNGGLIRAVISAPHAEAHIYLHGAHVTHYQPKGAPGDQDPVLFMSAKSNFEGGKPIRGGVPVIFPWFGDAGTPMHGFARLMDWSVDSVVQTPNGSIALALTLSSSGATRAQFGYDFTLRFALMVGKALELTLKVKNTSQSSFRFEEALHTYFSVGDVRQVSVEGLANTRYVSRLDPGKDLIEGAAPIRIEKETDRLYLATQATCAITDPVRKRRITVAKQGSDATVLWNPWIDKARVMPDFGDEEWPNMLCIETCNARAHAVELSPGRAHTMRAIIRTESL